MEECRRSPSAVYARLIDDIRNDTTRLSQFFETAGRVIDIDQKRQKSLAYVSPLNKAERAMPCVVSGRTLTSWISFA
jgi:hypothetical protein